MVTITGIQKKLNKNQEEFIVLNLQGEIEMIQSVSTGNWYASSHKTSITTTLDEETCIAIVGTQLKGEIKKLACEEYSFTVPETQETITLSHRYEYCPETVPVEEALFVHE